MDCQKIPDMALGILFIFLGHTYCDFNFVCKGMKVHRAMTTMLFSPHGLKFPGKKQAEIC